MEAAAVRMSLSILAFRCLSHRCTIWKQRCQPLRRLSKTWLRSLVSFAWMTIVSRLQLSSLQPSKRRQHHLYLQSATASVAIAKNTSDNAGLATTLQLRHLPSLLRSLRAPSAFDLRHNR